MTIMRVRRTLSETDIEMHGILALSRIAPQMPFHPWTWQVIIMTPVAVSMDLARVSPPVCGERKCVPNEPRYRSEGKATTQRFME